MISLNKRFETHSHSEYSNIRLLDSTNKIKDLILTAHELGLNGIALTDHECVCGHVDLLTLEKELKEQGKIPKDFKCACGNEIYLVDNRDKNEIIKYFHWILIAKNTLGHKALRELSSTAWYKSYFHKGMERVPTEKKELEEIIKKYPNSLIGTSACLGGEIPYYVNKLVDLERGINGTVDFQEIEQCENKINELIEYFKNLFNEDFYIEVAPAKSKDQIKFNKRIQSFAAKHRVKMIFASDAHYLTAEHRQIHKSYLNSKDGDREVDDFYYYAHLMDNDEAWENLNGVFSEESFNKMCNNSMEIYDKIGEYNIFHTPIIPKANVKNYEKTNKYSIEKYPILIELLNSNEIQERYWINQCLEGLEKKQLFNDKYLERLQIEADTIKEVGNKLNECVFSYFNTFQNDIDLFWECGSVVAPGRGSSVCFLSNYLLEITQLDPVEYALPFWRFLNKERIELPDIDTDLSPSKRPLILKKLREKHGELNVLQVCTFGTEGTRSAVNSACRGYRSEKYPKGLDVEIAQYLSNLIPNERGFLWDINEVINGNPEKDRKPVKSFINEINKYPGLLEIVQGIEGLICRRGVHASGVVIYNQPSTETNAVMKSPGGDLTTQFDLKRSEMLGDTKFDYLVTEISDKIAICLELLQQNGLIEKELTLREAYNKYLHPSVLPLEDPKIWNALETGKVMDVFQFNTDIGIDTVKKIKPKDPIQLMSANALLRLSGENGKERPMERYCRLKNNMNLWYEEVKNRGLSEKEIKVLEKYYLPMFGVPASQEDMMLVCMDQDIAKFTLSEANTARKIVG